MNCWTCNNDGFVSSEPWAAWDSKFEEGRLAGLSNAAALQAAGDRPSGPEEELCPECRGVAASGPKGCEWGIRALKSMGVANPEITISVSEDFVSRRKVVVQAWDGRDWARGSTIEDVIASIHKAKTSDPAPALQAAEVVAEEITAAGTLWAVTR
jgi:hypothetical protein